MAQGLLNLLMHAKFLEDEVGNCDCSCDQEVTEKAEHTLISVPVVTEGIPNQLEERVVEVEETQVNNFF